MDKKTAREGHSSESVLWRAVMARRSKEFELDTVGKIGAVEMKLLNKLKNLTLKNLLQRNYFDDWY